MRLIALRQVKLTPSKTVPAGQEFDASDELAARYVQMGLAKASPVSTRKPAKSEPAEVQPPLKDDDQ